MADPIPGHEEVWDDSHLVDSWNEAFEEYMKYHSIAAKGGKVSSPTGIMAAKELTNGDKESVPAATAEQRQDEAAESEEYEPSVGLASKSGQVTDASSASDTAANAAAAMPQLLMTNVQDDTMKKLMMSWYYAGYYTGLHEGKQQGFASAVEKQQQGG